MCFIVITVCDVFDGAWLDCCLLLVGCVSRLAKSVFEKMEITVIV